MTTRRILPHRKRNPLRKDVKKDVKKDVRKNALHP